MLLENENIKFGKMFNLLVLICQDGINKEVGPTQKYEMKNKN